MEEEEMETTTRMQIGAEEIMRAIRAGFRGRLGRLQPTSGKFFFFLFFPHFSL